MSNYPQVWAILEPRGMIGRTYVELHMTLLHTKYRSFGSCGFREEDFSSISHYKPTCMADNDTPRAGIVWTPLSLSLLKSTIFFKKSFLSDN